MDMLYQRQVIGMEIVQALFLPISHGSYEEETITLVLLRVRSAVAASMAVPASASVFVLCFPQLERKRLTLLKVVMNSDE